MSLRYFNRTSPLKKMMRIEERRIQQYCYSLKLSSNTFCKSDKKDISTNFIQNVFAKKNFAEILFVPRGFP